MDASGARGDAASSTTELPDLTEVERTVLEFIERAALQDRPLDPNHDIADHLGFTSTGGVPAVFRRLEAKGYIKVRMYQRGRQVYAARIDRWTRPPLCVVPHWRTILDHSANTPGLPVAVVMEFPNVMAAANRLQREHNLDFARSLLLLAAKGVQMDAFERAQGDWIGLSA